MGGGFERVEKKRGKTISQEEWQERDRKLKEKSKLRTRTRKKSRRRRRRNGKRRVIKVIQRTNKKDEEKRERME